ncbi:MAG: hypothetical protein RL094_376 [Candidatus Parcubacteria bacterium]|jgi:aquaporin Z
MKKYIAEFIGACTLTMAVLGTAVQPTGLPTVLAAGITLGLFVFTIGKISGAHINPAVTIGALSLKKISLKEAGYYIFAQFAGAALALIVGGLLHFKLQISGYFSWMALVGEAVGALIFTFGIASVVLARESVPHAAFIIGGSLTIGASIAVALGANGVLNPAVAFGIGSFGWAYLIGPIVGSVAGMWLYKGIQS